MSDEITKEKRSKRIHSDKVKSKRQMRIAKENRLTEFHPHMDNAHRFHKQHAMNCGNPNCVMCGNPRKFFGEKTIQERRFEQAEKDEV